MNTLLHIVGSPSAQGSRSRRVAEQFAAAAARHRPALRVDTLDPWVEDLPPFDSEMIQAKFAVLRRQDATEAQKALWSRAVRVARRFNAADAYVLSVPMWNFGLPYRLKHLIDVATLPGENWDWSPQTGYRSLLPGKRAVVVYSSAGDHPLAPGASGADPQKALIRAWLAFLGIELAGELNVAPTLAPAGQVAERLDACGRQAEDLASRLFGATPALPDASLPPA